MTIPPPLGTPLGVPRRIYLSIEIIDKGVIQNVPSRYPTSLLRAVTLPVHQVLESASPPSRVQNTIDRKGGFPINKSWRRGNRDRRVNACLKHRFYFRHMKGRMNSPIRRRKLELDRHRTNDPGDSERADKFGGKLVRNGSEWNVLSRKPHSLANDVYRRLRPVAIGLSLGARPHPEKSLTGSAPCVTAPLDESTRSTAAALSSTSILRRTRAMCLTM